jgi:diacylglycerol kinase (ATP)
MINEWYLIANPSAGSHRVEKEWEMMQSKIMEHLPIGEVAFTEGRGEATRLAKEAIESGYNKILAIGGDGTNHEVINGIMTQKRVPSSSVWYALIPRGTGNDWAKTYKLPGDLETILRIIGAGKSALQDVGQVHYHWKGEKRDRYFVNVAGMAYDGFICKIAEEQPGTVSNKFSYLWLIFRCLMKYSLQRSYIEIDGQQQAGKYYTINLGIGKYSGGGMQLVPHAQPDGGRFAITLAGNISKLGVLLNTYRFYNGSIGKHPKVQTLFGKKIKVTADANSPVLLEADGEFLGQTPVDFQLHSKALKIIIP